MSFIKTIMKNYIVREIYNKRLQKYVGKEIVKVLIGQRRVGKSFLLLQVMDNVLQKVPDANIVYLNLELNEFESITDYKKLYDHIKSKSANQRLNVVMIDEIQEVIGFEKTLKSLIAEGGYDLYCTGSNAHLLSGELATYLGGRYVEIQVHALSYMEFLLFHKLKDSKDSLDKYLKYGGLPYLIHIEMSDDTVFDYLNNINQSILFRDVVSRYNIRNVEFLVRLIRYLATETGNIISARNIFRYLKSQNIKISVNIVLSYLDYLSTAMLINKVQRTDIQGKRVFEIGEKYYFNDIGIRNAVAGFSPFALGQILENVIYLHLKIWGFKVHVGKQNGKEVDFIAERGGEKVYIQVALRITDSQTMQREFGNLKAIKDNFPKYVITLDDYKGASHEGIRHFPAREFLLSFEDLKL